MTVIEWLKNNNINFVEKEGFFEINDSLGINDVQDLIGSAVYYEPKGNVKLIIPDYKNFKPTFDIRESYPNLTFEMIRKRPQLGINTILYLGE